MAGKLPKLPARLTLVCVCVWARTRISITQICFISLKMLQSNEKIRFNIRGECMQSDRYAVHGLMSIIKEMTAGMVAKTARKLIG